MTQSKLESAFAQAWRIYAPSLPLPVPEWRFHPTRRWRFDFAFVQQLLAIELDGGQWQPHGGRHNTDADRDKLNAAAALGWRVMRFSASMLYDPERCVKTVVAALTNSQTIIHSDDDRRATNR